MKRLTKVLSVSVFALFLFSSSAVALEYFKVAPPDVVEDAFKAWDSDGNCFCLYSQYGDNCKC